MSVDSFFICLCSKSHIGVSLLGLKRFCTCSKLCSSRREVEELAASLFRFSKSWRGTRSARFEDEGPAPRSGVGIMSVAMSVDGTYSH